MSFSLPFFIASVAYLAVIGAGIYFCMFADPDVSPIAFFLTVTLPDKTWALLEKILPKSGLKFVQFLSDRALVLVYLFIVLGSYAISIFYVFPWVDSQEYLFKESKYIGLFFMSSAIVSWRKISTCSPGIITPQTVDRYQHYPYDEILFVANERCKTTGVIRPARSKFDRYRHHANVARFDHYCGWTGNTIGEENYRYFLLFLWIHWCMCAYATWSIGCLFYGHVLDQKLLDAVFFDRVTGEEFPAGKWIIFQYLFQRFTLQAGLWLLMAVLTIALALFGGYHFRLTSINMTTNESFKWDQVNQWYKRELRMYNEAVKRGDAVVEGASTPNIVDGDVTCTSASSGEKNGDDPSAQATEASSVPAEHVIRHPGPKPVNIYDRGFVENWKEVLFPISLRNVRSVKPKSV